MITSTSNVQIKQITALLKKSKERKEQKCLQLLFMSLGLILGITINSKDMLPCDHSLVLSICTLWGLAIGTFVEAKEKK